MSNNPFQALRQLLPLPPVLVGIVREHHSDDTSTVEIPGGLPITGYATNVATGSLIRPRGTTVPVGAKAFVRAGVIETRAPDADPIPIVVGIVVPPPPAVTALVTHVRMTALTAYPAYNQQTYTLLVHLRRASDQVFELLQFSGQGVNTHNAFNPNAFASTSQNIYWGDLDGGTLNVLDTNWSLPLGYSQTIPCLPTTSFRGLTPDNSVFDGMRCAFSLSAFAGSTPVFHAGQVQVELLDAAANVLASQVYTATDSAYFRGVRGSPSTGDPYDAAI